MIGQAAGLLRALRSRSRPWPPLLVWSLALIATLFLYVRQEAGLTVVGIAAEVRYGVAATIAGRLETLQVQQNQFVEQGQIIAALDDGELLLDLHAARLELDRLSAESGRQKASWEFDATGQQLDRQRNLREFAGAADDAQLAYLEAVAELAENRIERDGLELTLNRSRESYESEVAPAEDLEQDRTAYEARNERVTRQTAIVEELARVYRDAQARYQGFLGECGTTVPDTLALLRPLQYELELQAVRIEKICRATTGLLLRAPAGGQITTIDIRPGEVVAAGQPVVSIVEPTARHVVAYLPEDSILAVQPGAKVEIRPVADQRLAIHSTVSELGAGVQRLPERLELQIGQPAWGRAVYIPLPETAVVRPGEAFEVRF